MTGTLTETNISLSISEQIGISLAISAMLVHQMYLQNDSSLNIRLAQREIELFVQTATGALTQQQFEELEERIRQKLNRRNRKKLYLHYSFTYQWGNLIVGLAPAGVYNPGGSFATRDVYITGWYAKWFLALPHRNPPNSIYIVMPKYGYGPTK